MDLRAAMEGNILHVKAVPGARATAVLGIDNGVARIAVAARPEDGRANRELERFLSRMTGKDARVLSGASARRKRVLLE